MTVIISSSYLVGLVSGVGIQFDPPMAAVPALTTDDIYDPDYPTQTLTETLDTFSLVNMVGVASVDMTVLGTSPVYTVSAQQTFIPTQIIFVLTDIAGSGDAPTLCVGFTTSFRQIIDSSRTSTLFDEVTNVGQIVSVTNFADTAGHSGADYKYLSGGDTLTVRVDHAATYPTYTLQCLAFGFVFGNSPPGSVATSIYGRGLYGVDLFGEA
jgi:hypothetical protein